MIRTIQRGAKVDTIACAWLISRFVDKEAEFIFVPERPDPASRDRFKFESLPATGRIPVLRRTAFRELLSEHHLLGDGALTLMECIVSAADRVVTEHVPPQAAGIRALTIGFALLGSEDDLGQLEREFAAYDALHAWCVMQVRANPHV